MFSVSEYRELCMAMVCSSEENPLEVAEEMVGELATMAAAQLLVLHELVGTRGPGHAVLLWRQLADCLLELMAQCVDVLDERSSSKRMGNIDWRGAPGRARSVLINELMKATFDRHERALSELEILMREDAR